MSKFTGDLSVSFSAARYALLKEPLIWEIDYLGSGLRITVPAGFHSDGATVPRPLWWLMPPWGDKGTRAAILHDYLLEELEAGRKPHELINTRERADWQFYLALKALGVAEWRARICWLGVRAYSTYSILFGIYADPI